MEKIRIFPFVNHKFCHNVLTLKMLITATADDTLKFLFYLSEKIRLDILCEYCA